LKMSAEAPLVSVILPVYNGEKSVGDAIRSALCQTYRNIEVIVVDDGSTDATAAALQSIVATDGRLRVFSQANAGVARARNLGLSAARGEFIAPLDADDLWDPAKIERQVDRMLEAGEETGLVYCWWVWIDDHGTVLDRSPAWQVEGEGAAEILLQVNYTGNASVPLYRRHCIEEAGGYDEMMEQRGARGCEDWDLALKVAERYSIAVVPELLVGYRRRRDSMSSCCDVMWESQSLMAAAARERAPELAPGLLRGSADQFALYLAGISFWSGSYLRAVRWGLRAWRSRIALRVLPHAIGLLARRLLGVRGARGPVMAPGVPLDRKSVAGPLIPYDRIYGLVGGVRRG
jgi:glycosyltransferase involved in cell wall biosynthesis